MKTQLLCRFAGTVIGLALLLLSASFARTMTYERIIVTIPFDFSVHQRVFPAGTYIVTQIRDEPDAPGVDSNNHLYEIQSEDHRGPRVSMQTTSLGAYN